MWKVKPKPKYRRPTTPKVKSAARRNIQKAQISRTRTREPRSVGRHQRSSIRGMRPATMQGRK